MTKTVKKRTMLHARILIEVPENKFLTVLNWAIRQVLMACANPRWGMVVIRLYGENGEMLGTYPAGRIEESVKKQLDAIFDGENGAA